MGQVFLKLGAGSEFRALSDRTLLHILLDRHTLAGVFLYGFSFLCWLKVLAAWPLSKAYPVLALNFGLVALLAACVLKEPLTPARVVGTLLCAAGVALLGAGSSQPPVNPPSAEKEVLQSVLVEKK